jgi:hypothetical protein
MRTWKRLSFSVLIVLMLVFAGAVAVALATPLTQESPAAAEDFQLTWQVLAEGGQTMSSGSYRMLSTAGQPITGPASSESYSLLSGYWNAFQAAVQRVLLPIIIAD